jgi:hypothetical protein
MFRQATCKTNCIRERGLFADDLTYMRQLQKFGDCYRSQQRGFFTEAQFLKPVKARDPDNLISRILPKPNLATNTTTTEAATIPEPARQFALANGGSQ